MLAILAFVLIIDLVAIARLTFLLRHRLPVEAKLSDRILVAIACVASLVTLPYLLLLAIGKQHSFWIIVPPY